MRKLNNLLTIFFISMVSIGYSQPNYPIQTILKGDPVVIYTKEQNDGINILIDSQKNRIQKYKTDVQKLVDTNQVLKSDIQLKDSIIDSLNNLLMGQNMAYDSLINKLDTIENWVLNHSINNAYMYYSWQDSTIKVVDLTLYMLVSNKRTGNYQLIVRDEITNIDYWRNKNLLDRESPQIGWELKISPKYRPRIILFPYKLTPKL